MDVNPRGFQIQLDVGETSSNSGQGFEESDGSMRSESNEVFPSFHSSDGNNSNSRGDGSLFVVALGADEAAPTVPFTDDVRCTVIFSRRILCSKALKITGGPF
jgi:hypothetical protein